MSVELSSQKYKPKLIDIKMIKGNTTNNYANDNDKSKHLIHIKSNINDKRLKKYFC